MKNTLLTIALILNTVIFSASDAPIKQSIAILESNVGKMSVEMKMLDQDTWVLYSLLDGSLVRREETETFRLIRNKVQPLSYSINEKRIFKSRYKSSAEFDWRNKEIIFTDKKEKGIAKFNSNVLGPSSASLQLRLDFKNFGEGNIPNEISYDVYLKGAIKRRIYDINLNKEKVKSAIGIYEAYKVSRRFNEGSERTQILWLAPELDYSVIKMYDKNGFEFRADIKSFKDID